jgi:hypothetical protein
MGRQWLVLCLVVVAAFAAACAEPASAPGSPASSAFTVAEAVPLASGLAGDFRVVVVTSPGPPAPGTVALEALVSDAFGNPVSDATVTFDINMTNMNHGKNTVTASSQGDGRYAGEMFFMMPGPWRVLVGIERGSVQSSVRFDFMVQ